MIQKILGILILFACFTCIYLFESHSNHSGIFRVLHWPAMLLTGIGPVGLLLVCFDGSSIIQGFKLVFRSPSQCRRQMDNERRILKELIGKFYTVGAKVFEEVSPKEISPAAVSVLEKLALRIPIGDAKALLQFQKEKSDDAFSRAMGVMSLGVKLTPSVGMLGTILGMVQLLESLKDPSEIGSHMSLALLTTFFGLFFSLTFWTPALNRLQSLQGYQNLSFEQLYHWLTLLEERKPPEYWVDGKN